MIRSLRVLGSFFVSMFLLAFCLIGAARAVNRDWNTASGNWNVAGNWTPNGAPSNGTPAGVTYDVQIGNLPAALNAQVTYVPVISTSGTVSTLSLSNGADLFTNGSQLNVLTQTTVDGAGTTIRIDPHASPGTPSFQTADLDLNNGGGLTMSGGVATVSTMLEINVGSVLGGHGEVDVGDFDLVADQAFENSGLLQPQSNTAAPQTLTIHTSGLDTIDLDGDSEAGVVDVDNALANVNSDTVTLVIDGPLADAFGGGGAGALQIGQRDTVTFTHDFSMAGANVQMTGGNNIATLNGAGAVTSITTSAFTVTNSAVITNDMAFSGTANTITVNANSTLELAGTVTIPDASALTLTSNTSALIISGNTTVTEAAGDFNWDGPGTVGTTVKGTGQLNLTVAHVNAGNDTYTGTLNLDDDGDISVNNGANAWTMGGTIHKRNAGTSAVTGDAVSVTGSVTVDALGTLTMPTTTTTSTANLLVNGTLTLGGASVIAGANSVNGTGTLRFLGTSTVTASTIINTTSFDWDGLGSGTLQTINSGAVLTINSTTFDSDGIMNDPVSIGGNGAQLAMNGVSEWTMVAALTTNAADIGTATIGGTARMKFSTAGATWFVSGNTNTTAPVTFDSGSSVAIVAARTLRLDAGGFGSDANVISGSTITGPGTLAANTAHALRGFGTIGAPIDFDGTSAVFAEGGTLTINGAILDVGTIGPTANDGILNIPAAWNSSVADFVNLAGGIIQGGTITVANTNGIAGRGTVASRVINNTKLSASNVGQTLIFETATNDNDWDGGANTGVLAASNGGTLEVRDNATFTYGGTITATGGSKVYAKGFGFNMFSTSVINLTTSTFQTDESTDIRGAVNVAAGGDSTINVQVNRFLTLRSTSVTTLNSNLRLETNNGDIEAGAVFSGPGAIILPSGSHLITDNGAIINVLLDNEGTLRPAGFNTVGSSTIKDYQQTDTGLAEFELTGTLLNQYDRLVMTGVAQLDGHLNVDIDGAFVPALGNTFNIISAPGGVIGTFDNIDVSGMPAGLTFHINYLGTAVQLQVVAKPNFEADFDDDGDVDSTDYEIWRHAFQLNQLGDATGDNISDAADYVLWRKQLGSHPGAGSGSLADGAAVPEPSAALMLLLGAALLPRGRRR